MDNYFYLDASGVQKGPVSLEQLKSLGISAFTPVWKQGLAGWSKASLLPELATLFPPMPATPPPPPPMPSQTHQQYSQQPEASQPQVPQQYSQQPQPQQPQAPQQYSQQPQAQQPQAPQQYPQQPQATQPQAQQPRNPKMSEAENSPVNYIANYFTGPISHGGKIYIGEEEIFFKTTYMPIPVRRVMALKDITGYKKGFLSTMVIYGAGVSWRLAVWKKNAIINDIEQRRQAWFTKRGLPIPQLSNF